MTRLSQGLSALPRRRHLWALMTLCLAFLTFASPTRADNRLFLVDSEPDVYLNWQSFLDNDFPASWEDEVLDAVINAYTRWEMVAAARVRPKFQGYTTRTEPNTDEIIVQANMKHSNSNRLGSTFGSYRKIKIVIHRQQGSTNTNWNWVPDWAEAGEHDMQAVLIHEFGHALGLDHTPGARDCMNGGYQWHRQRFGPNSTDIAALQALYGVRQNDRIHLRRSTNSGASWHNQSTNLSGLGISSSIDPTATRDPDRSILFYTSPTKKPSWIIGNKDGTSFDTGSWSTFGGLRSIYGVSGHGFDDEYMMAWVDHSSDDMNIKVVRSTNGGSSWSWRNPPSDSCTIGTPAIRKLGPNQWILAYAKLDLDDRTNTGKVAVRVSTNDGASWGPEQVLNDYYRAIGGVSITDDGGGNVRIGFSWTYGHRIRTIRAHVQSSTVTYHGMMYGGYRTRTQPVLGATYLKHFLGYREQNYMTSVDTLRTDTGSSFWSNFLSLPNDTSTHTTPGLATYKNLSWAFLYLAQD